MSSLETVQPSLDEYLRSFEFDPANIQGQAYHGGSGGNKGDNGPGETWMYVPSSDAFLQGVLTGHWNGPPPSGPPSSQQQNSPYQADLLPLGAPRPSERPLDPRSQGYNEAQLYQTHVAYTSSPAPPSDGDGSLSSTTSNIPLADASRADDLQASFLWDNFLRELGVQGDSA
jgi:hypothetical protein